MNKLEVAEKYDIKVNLCGGGFTGQSQALRLAIARALVKINPEDKKTLRAEGFMTRDPRSVERKNRVVQKHVADSSSVNVKSWWNVGTDKLLNFFQLSLFNSQLRKRLVSNRRDFPYKCLRRNYPAVGSINKKESKRFKD